MAVPIKWKVERIKATVTLQGYFEGFREKKGVRITRTPFR